MAFLCPMRVKRIKKLKDEMQSWELDSTLYASLDAENAPDCTPEHALPGARCNLNHLNSSSMSLNKCKCPCNTCSVHPLNKIRPSCIQTKGSMNKSHKCSGDNGAISSLLCQQLSELRLQSTDQSTGSSSGCHSQSTLASDETLYVNTQQYENWSAFNSRTTGNMSSVTSGKHMCTDTTNEEYKHISSDKPALLQPFDKQPCGRLLTLYSYVPVDENDVHVRRGELLTALNRDDPNWLWVVKSNGQQGFVPSNFVCPLELINSDNVSTKPMLDACADYTSVNKCELSDLDYETVKPNATDMIKSSDNRLTEHLYCNVPFTQATQPEVNSDEFDTQLVVLFDFDAQAPDDLSVNRGEWVMTRLSNQQVDGWLWVYSPRSDRCGYIPKAYARPPAMTSL